jgi:hydrogenase maturation protein HypF
MNRIQLSIQGTVQGVGFRPYIAKLAHKYDLSGWVINSGDGVTLQVQGETVEQFIQEIPKFLPPMANIDKIESRTLKIAPREEKFCIRASKKSTINTELPSDAAICNTCIEELFNPTSRYFQYPFISCTDCGPRITTTRYLPYDRSNTSFDEFPLCSTCQEEYLSPLSRRFHAQTIACEECGPEYSHSADEIASLLNNGKIIALKGVGGYHLLADANNKSTLKELRKRKKRVQKPFALMALNKKSILPVAVATKEELEAIKSSQRPIVVLKANQSLAEEVAPGLASIGLMLPYTGIHYLIFHALLGKPQNIHWLEQACKHLLVVTSANHSGQPIIVEDDDQQLHRLADVVVSHQRKIVTSIEDSVIKLQQAQKIYIRRSRGYVPDIIKLPHAIPQTLALGGLLKNTFCFTRDDKAYLSQPVGDLSNPQVTQQVKQNINDWQSFFGFKPQRYVIDKHPNHPLRSFVDSDLIDIQHHHAHIAQVICQKQLYGPVIGLALDGIGYGEDGCAWGGELFYCSNSQYKRLGSLSPLAMPGGDAAAIECWRMAASVLFNSRTKLNHLNCYPVDAIWEMISKEINSPKTSSMGRVFDAASSLLNVCHVNSYEAEAALKLESLVTELVVEKNTWAIKDGNLDLSGLLELLTEHKPVSGANLLHGSLIAALNDWLHRAIDLYDCKQLVLSGGCFFNHYLSSGIISYFSNKEVAVHLSSLPGDGGLSLGQAWLANTRESGLCA